MIIDSFWCLRPFSMPGDATVIKRGKNACCHGDYVGGRAEIIQIVIMVGKEMWCPETRWRTCQRRWGDPLYYTKAANYDCQVQWGLSFNHWIY